MLVDPIRALRVLGLEAGRSFSQKVLYIYDRQLAEADLIVVNKVDLLDEARLERLRDALAARYPQAEVLAASARDGSGLTPWFERVTRGAMGPRRAARRDYQTYAEGEALLGWLNATVAVSSKAPFDGNALLRDLAARLAKAIGAERDRAFEDDADGGRVAVGHRGAESGGRGPGRRAGPHAEGDGRRGRADPQPAGGGESGAPQRSGARGARGVEAGGAGRRAAIEHIEHFRPAKPTPTYRLATV